MRCATHPGTETELRCGRCEKAICPRCMIMTPGGQRCRECAQLRPPPSYDVRAMAKIRAAIVAAGVGVAGGVIWWVLPPFIGLFMFLFAAGLGYAMAAAISRVTNRKRGYVLQITAGFGILLAYFVRNLLEIGAFVQIGGQSAIFGYIAVAIAIAVAIGPLR
jgi:hypothetical protein